MEHGRDVLHGLDYIRFAAAVMVVVYHYGYWSWTSPLYPTGLRRALGVDISYPELAALASWGWVGVEIFFVISGFVISISAEGRSWSGFLRARFLRLAPALWAFATLALVVTWAYAPISVSDSLLLYVKSVLLVPKGPWLDGVYWTLTVEVVFYSAIMALLYFRGIENLAAITYVWGGTAAAFWLGCALGEVHLLPDASAAFLTAVRQAYVSRLLLITTGPFFVLGIALYLVYRHGVSAGRLTLLAISACAGEIAIFFNARQLAGESHAASATLAPAVVWLIAVLAIGAAISAGRRTATATRPKNTAARILGLASYPLYLVHYVSGAFFMGLLLKAGMTRYSALLLALAACIAISIAFAVYLEPWLRERLAAGLDQIRRAISAVLTGWARPRSASTFDRISR